MRTLICVGLAFVCSAIIGVTPGKSDTGTTTTLDQVRSAVNWSGADNKTRWFLKVAIQTRICIANINAPDPVSKCIMSLRYYVDENNDLISFSQLNYNGVLVQITEKMDITDDSFICPTGAPVFRFHSSDPERTSIAKKWAKALSTDKDDCFKVVNLKLFNDDPGNIYLRDSDDWVERLRGRKPELSGMFDNNGKFYKKVLMELHLYDGTRRDGRIVGSAVKHDLRKYRITDFNFDIIFPRRGSPGYDNDHGFEIGERGYSIGCGLLGQCTY